MSKPNIVLLDEINCSLVNFPSKTLQYFHKKFQYEVPSARFSPKYQLGIWDGKISFFTTSGNTYINLLPKIVPDLLKLKIKFEVVDSRSKSKISLNHIDKDFFNHIIHPDTQEPIEMRHYQVNAVNKLIDERGGILLGSTGCGKTIITAAICKVYNNIGIKSLVIVPSVSLLNQTKKVLINCELDIGELSGKLKDPNHETVISTWQTLQNIKPIVTSFQMILIDETHQAKAQVIKDILSSGGKNIKYRYGLTGTMPKDEIDLVSINTILNDIVYEIPARQLINEGFLADLHIQINQLTENFEEQYSNFIENNPRSKIKYSQFKNSYFPDYQAEKTYLRTNENRLNYLADLLIERSLIGNVFALVDNIQFGKKLLKIIKTKHDGEHTYFVSGGDDAKNRQKIYDLFKNNDNILCIATVHCAGIGTDISRIYQLFLIDLGKSFIRTIQAIGRGLRKAKDKDYIDVVDISSDLKYSKNHVSERIRFYKEAEYPYTKSKIAYCCLDDQG
jgi:superfamily II DNA or RNA helicase